ncbi:hypothetical protein [Hymenobacter sp. 102]|uniref:hypothetical protein n=1 Tax=Hymenobacter sp. 102 TaxID=3403152 RepID=UPI003CFA4908
MQQYPDVLESTSATKLKNYYLFNAEEEGALRYKLMLTRGDKQSLIDVLEGHPKPPVEVASNVRRNYEYFRKHLTLKMPGRYMRPAAAIYRGCGAGARR